MAIRPSFSVPMNIFITHQDPKQSAQFIWKCSPQRARKMILEGMQMLAVGSHRYHCEIPITKSGKPYGVSHPDHTVTKWAVSNPMNYKWLIDYVVALDDMFKDKTGKHHGATVNDHANNIVIVKMTLLKMILRENKMIDPFVNYAKSKESGFDFSKVDDVFEAYKGYLLSKVWINSTLQR